MTRKLICFNNYSTSVSYDRPRPDRLLTGNPLRSTWSYYEESGVSSGIWSCEIGSWSIAFADNKSEFFHVISGRITITDSDGEQQSFGPGEAGVIPEGFTGAFQVVEPVTKHYVVVERSE